MCTVSVSAGACSGGSAADGNMIGRTGRAGKMGTAITFLTNDDEEVMWVLR